MRAVLTILLGIALCVLPGTYGATEAADKAVLRVALILPRSPQTVLEMKRWEKRVKDATDDRLSLKVYYGGSAGDEAAVIRKMRMGQVDASVVTTAGLSQFVRQALVLDAPGLFDTYAQLDAVRADLAPVFEEEAQRNGFKILGWGDAGMLRMMSAQPVRRLEDIKKMRPWLWPENPVMKVFYDAIGVTGVPLGLVEVYGALQTNMVDFVLSSAISAMALQWFTKTPYVTAQGSGYINGAFVISKSKFDSLPEGCGEALVRLAKQYNKDLVEQLRKTDKQAFDKLLQRGLTAIRFEDEDRLRKVAADMRVKMVGRIYSKEVLDRVEAVAAKAK